MKPLGTAFLAASGWDWRPPPARALEVTEFPITVDVSFPRDPAPHPDGAVWFVAMSSDKVIRLDPTSEKAEVVKSPSRGTHIRKMATDAEGKVWFVGSSSKTVGFIK